MNIISSYVLSFDLHVNDMCNYLRKKRGTILEGLNDTNVVSTVLESTTSICSYMHRSRDEI